MTALTGPWYVAWKYEDREGRPTKVPYTAPDQKADVWGAGPFLPFADAVALSQRMAGIGLVVSAAHDWVGIDLDGCRDRDTGELTPWAQQIVDGLRTPAVPTPSGWGVRVWVRAPKDPAGPRKRVWKQSAWTAPPGCPKTPQVEVFLTGGYCTIPVEGLTTEPPLRPSELAALLASAPPPSARPALAAVPPRHPELSVPELCGLIALRHPKRYHKLFIAGPVDRDDDSDLDRELAGYAADVVGGDVPRIEQVMRRSALTRPKWDRADYLTRTIALALATVRPDAEADAAAVVQARSLDAIWADPDALKPRETVIPRLAWRGRLTVYSAPDKGGKSTLVAAGVAALTAGQPFLGEQVAPGRAVWCLLEEHVGDFAPRAKQLGTPGDRVMVFELQPGLTDLRREVAAHHAAVVVIDTLVEWAGDRVTEGGQAAQWVPVMRELRTLARECNVAVVLLHHARKSDGLSRDSGHITAQADVILEQTKTPKQDGGQQHIQVRGRWVQPDFTVRLHNGRHELVTADGGDAPPDIRLTREEKKMLAALIAGMAWSEWLKAYGGKDNTFKSAVRRLRLKGLVTQDEQRGTWSPNQFALSQAA